MARSSRSFAASLFPDALHDRLNEMIGILKAIGLPKPQQNNRSARVFLAYLNVRPSTPWAQAEAPSLGMHEVMDWIADNYNHRYAENTRETLRRRTVHQMVQAGVLIKNPDDPSRPVNSPHTVYGVSPHVLELVRTFGTSAWDPSLARYLTEAPTLATRYAQARQQVELEVQLAPGLVVALSAGGQNPLIRKIVHKFVPQFVREPRVLYLGDAGAKSGHWDDDELARLGLSFDRHGQMPDVIVHDGDRNWLVLVEAVTSHGPVDPKRMMELKELFKSSTAGLVFVTAFPDRKTFRKYLADIAWETEVWIADDPTHMVHFNGERFLGPYE